MNASTPVDGGAVPQVGAVIAKKYTLIEELGPGDSGQLFLAEQTTLRKQVVAKIIDPELSANEEFAGKVLREARILSLIRHANVARLMSYGKTKSGAVYLIYEHLEGADLRSLQAGTQRFPWPRTKALILQVLGGLRVAEGKGIIHGGVRPSNVFMVDAGDGLDHVKLLAFGLSPAPRLDIFSGPELLEVAEFAAPEEAEGKPFDVRADVYSVGVLLYSLLTGSVPFTAKEPHQVVTQHTMASPPPPRNIAPDADIPPPVEALILRCLAKAPEDRYPDLAALEHDLREISDEGKVPRRGSASPTIGGSTSGAMSQLGAQPTKDSALFYSIEALQGMLASAPSPDAQLQVLDKMDRALDAMAGEAKDSEDYLRWSEWINQGRDYAYFQLGQRHHENKRWRELEGVYLQRLELAKDDDAVHKLMGSLADLYLKHILNFDKAIEIYNALIDADDLDMEAHLGLAQALERKQEIEAAIPHYERFIELCTDSKRCADQLAHLGEVHHKLSETDSAIARLYQATELDPTHLEALKLLADLFRARHEWIELVEALEAIVEHTTSTYERVERATEAGFVWLEKLQVKDRALQMFAKVVEIDPENAKVGPILGKIYYEQKNYVAAAPIFDALVRKIDNLGLRDSSKVGVLVRAGQVARAVGSTTKASKLFKRALDIDPESTHALVGVAELAMVRKSWDEARMAYERLLGKRQDEAKANVHVKLAEIALAQGRSDIAIQNYKAALKCDAKHVHAHTGLLEIYAENKDWRGLLKTHQGRLPTLEGDAKAAAFVEIGKIFRDHLGEPGRAVAAFQRAHELRPDDKTLLHTLLDLHTEAKRWTEAMPILDELIACEKEPKRRAKYLYTSAAIQRDNLDAADEALRRFDMVLDDDREFLKAFQAIDTILTKRKDWKALERAYRKMIKRLPADDKSPLKQLLWHNLAEIYRSRVGDYASAAKALEVALKLDPSNFKRQLMVTELYGMLMQKDPAQYTDALIRSHNTLIRLDPSYYRSYHQLYNIYRHQNEIDKAYCLARTLLFLKQATDEEAAFYRSGPPAVFRQARLRLSEDTLQRTVLPGDQDPTVSAILGLVDPALATWRSKPPPPMLRGSEPIDTSESPSLPAQALQYVSRIINVQQPELHFLQSEPGDVTIHSVRRRGGEIEQVAIARGSLLRNDRSDGEVVFEVARHLLDLYPPHHAFFLLERSPQNLGQLLVACSVLAERGSGDGGQGVQVIIQELVNRLPPVNLEKIKTLARELGQTDVKRWARAAAIAGYRLGLLLSNDLEAAAKAIRSEQRSSAVNITGKDALTELIVYSVSEAYFEARRSIGLAVA